MQLCTLCRRYFPGSTCLHMHQKTHHKTRLNDDIILKCSYCSGVFREQGSLEEHVRFFHLEEECLICGHVSVGAFESYEHIGEFHSPLYIPGNIIQILLFRSLCIIKEYWNYIHIVLYFWSFCLHCYEKNHYFRFLEWKEIHFSPIAYHTSYRWIIMLEKCGHSDLHVFCLKWIIDKHGNWKNQNPGGRFGALS